MEINSNKEIKNTNINADANRGEIKFILNALKALSNESRLKIFRMLVEAGHSGLTVTVISERLNMPISTLSFHLTKLSHANLVLFIRQSRFIIYSVNFEAMNKLINYLTENCCNGDKKSCFSGL
jgi:DNA-binding transcriptional ArsR family regulator